MDTPRPQIRTDVYKQVCLKPQSDNYVQSNDFNLICKQFLGF